MCPSSRSAAADSAAEALVVWEGLAEAKQEVTEGWAVAATAAG